MTGTKAGSTGDTLLGGIRNSPEAKRLVDEARNLFDAQTNRLSSKVTDGVGGVANKLTNLGETGSLPNIGEGAKRLISGEGPLRSAMGAMTGVADKAKGLVGGKKSGKGGGAPKAINIEESIDIGVPVSVAYDQWTQFEEFSRFTKGVESVEQDSDTETIWRAKVFKSRRTWKSKIVEQIPDRRIVWTSEGDKGTVDGVVTFHPLADDLTRVLVALEYYPSGVIEKTGNLWRAAGRRTRLDLKNFRRFVMMQKEPTGSWRGEIREGEVVKGPEDGGGRGRSEQPRKSNGEGRARREASSSGAGSRTSSSPARKSSGEGQRATKSSPSMRSSSGPAKKSASKRPAKKAESRPRKSASASERGSSGGSPRKASSRSSGGSSARKQPAKKSTARKRTSK